VERPGVVVHLGGVVVSGGGGGGGARGGGAETGRGGVVDSDGRGVAWSTSDPPLCVTVPSVRWRYEATAVAKNTAAFET